MTYKLTSPSLVWRAVVLAAILGAEIVTVSIWLDTAALTGAGRLTAFIGDWGPPALRLCVVFAACLLAVTWSRRSALDFRHLPIKPISPLLLTAHFCAITAFLVISGRFFGGASAAAALAILWLAIGAASLLLLAAAILSPVSWIGLAKNGWPAVWRAIALAGGVFSVAQLGRSLWAPTTELTFAAVRIILSPFVSGLIANSATKVIGTSAFSVTISPQCSGLEGVALISGFGALWLILFRRDYRFPQAIALIPAGAGFLWLLNSFRIATLILIGNAGAAGLALGGFHSQAGWILFNLVALAFSVAGGRMPWVSRQRSLALPAPNPVAAYLAPFLAILAATMISRTLTSSGFEWFYPLRFIFAIATVWCFRSAYAGMNWRGNWLSVTAGVLVFAIWLGVAYATKASGPGPIAAGLKAMSGSGRALWLLIRILAATVTVPIAEELAFRGFLIRRLIAADFESLDPRRYTGFAVFGSSLAFGLLHGQFWVAGTIAGLIYSAVFLRRGRIGDSVWAHAITNACLAIWVLWTQDWSLW